MSAVAETQNIDFDKKAVKLPLIILLLQKSNIFKKKSVVMRYFMMNWL